MAESYGWAGKILRVNLTTGEITSDEFLDSVRPILLRRLADDIETSGYDLDPATKDTMK